MQSTPFATPTDNMLDFSSTNKGFVFVVLFYIFIHQWVSLWLNMNVGSYLGIKILFPQGQE